jgi:hypothetical protein
MIGRSGPIDAGGDGPQRATQASGMGVGRGRAICEYDEIMQILPGSSDEAVLINATTAFCNIAPSFAQDTLSFRDRKQPPPELTVQ